MNQRVEFVLKALRTENFRELCKEYRISAKTGYKWRERFMAQGLGGLEELSRRPLSSPGGLEEAIVCEIVRLKERHRHWGPRKLRAVYERIHGEAPSESSFKRVLEKAGLTEKRQTRKRQSGGRLYNGRQAKEPNEVWTVDFKGWWYVPGGTRCEPLTVRDEFSRYLLELRALEDSRTETVRRCFEQLFEKYGLPQAIRSDNGSPFAHVSAVLGLSQLSAWWLVLGIDLERGRPGCPQDNGAHERMHLDISREVEGEGLGEQQAALDEWRKEFNQERPHESLGMKRPVEVYAPSQRKYEGTPLDLEYGSMQRRKVSVTGRIKMGLQSYFISTALRGWSIGLQWRAPGEWDVWFGRLLLGRIVERTASFEPAEERRTQEESETAA
jgi:putative transposase